MDILNLVDRLEELLNESRPIPLTHSVVVDEDRVLELIDQMRISVPDEVKKAQQVLAQRDKILAKGKEEADRTISLAKKQGEEAVDRDAIVQGAEERAEEILDQARVETAAIRQKADEHVAMALGSLEEELNKLLNQTRKGIADIEAKRLQAVAEKQPPLVE